MTLNAQTGGLSLLADASRSGGQVGGLVVLTDASRSGGQVGGVTLLADASRSGGQVGGVFLLVDALPAAFVGGLFLLVDARLPIGLQKYGGLDLVATWGAFTLHGMTALEITEKAGPLPKMWDTTSAPAAAYEYTVDPLESAGPPQTEIAARGMLSVTDYEDLGFSTLTEGDLATMTIYPAGELTDHARFTLACYYRGLSIDMRLREQVTYRATWAAYALATWERVA